jgi:hypothetical protein
LAATRNTGMGDKNVEIMYVAWLIYSTVVICKEWERKGM